MKFRQFRLMNDTVGDTGSGPEDRGDDFVPTSDEPAAPEKVEPAKEVETEVETETETETETEAKPKAKDPRIPLSRHEAVLNKEREKRQELERQLAQYQRGTQLAEVNADITTAENTVLALETEYANLLTDGEIAKATAVMAKIRAAERSMAEAKNDMKIQAAEIRATERARYQTTLERIEAAFPSLNPDHEDYDAEAEAEVADLKAAYESRGMPPAAALQKAVKLIVEPRTTRQEIATSTKAQVDPKAVAAERKKDAVTNAVKAVGATPPSTAKIGLDSDKAGGGAIDAKAVMSMSQKAFAALNEETLSKMRGDTL